LRSTAVLGELRSKFFGASDKTTIVARALVVSSHAQIYAPPLLCRILSMKRKTDCGLENEDGNGEPDTKKRAPSNEKITDRFRDGLLDQETLEEYKKLYANSEP